MSEIHHFSRQVIDAAKAGKTYDVTDKEFLTRMTKDAGYLALNEDLGKAYDACCAAPRDKFLREKMMLATRKATDYLFDQRGILEKPKYTTIDDPRQSGHSVLGKAIGHSNEIQLYNHSELSVEAREAALSTPFRLFSLIAAVKFANYVHFAQVPVVARKNADLALQIETAVYDNDADSRNWIKRHMGRTVTAKRYNRLAAEDRLKVLWDTAGEIAKKNLPAKPQALKIK